MTSRKSPPRFESYRPAQEHPEVHYGSAQGPCRSGLDHGEHVHPGSPVGRHPSQIRGTTPRRPGSPVLTGLLYGVLALVAFAGGAAAFLVMALPADLVQSRVAAEIKERTGRDLVIAEPASFTFYPSLGVTLTGVSLSAAPGMEARPLVTMAGFDVSVGLLPLLRREVQINRLVLRKPKFSLEVDAKGRRNWQFAGLGSLGTPVAPVRLPQAASAWQTEAGAAADVTKSRGRHVNDLVLADVRIEDGTLHYADAQSGSVHDLGAINASLTMKSISSPLDVKGDLVWKSRPVGFDAKLTSVASVLEERPAKLELALTSEAIEATFDGTALFKDALTAEGMVDAKSPSARKFASWLGAELAPSKGFGMLTVRGFMRVENKALALSSAQISLDGATAQGQVSIETGAERPLLKANLEVNELNLNNYARSDAALPSTAAPVPDTAGSQGSAETIDDLLERALPSPAPSIERTANGSGWSQEPFDVSAFGLIDAQANLSVDRLIVRDMRAGPSKLTVALKNRVMTATFGDVALYEGHAQGSVTIDATAPDAPSAGANMTLDRVSALPLLKDAAGVSSLSGKGRLAFTLVGEGQNEREIIETLNGKIGFKFTDGAIAGINIPQMVRGMSEGRLGDLKAAPTEKTDFSELAATWTVSAGVAQNRDLQLTGPLLRVTGEGRVMLAPREVDYLLRPKLVAELAGQGGEPNLSEIEVPVRIEGSWERPKFKADLQAVLKDPNKAVDTIKEIGKKFKGKNAGEIFQDLFGGKGGDGDAPPQADSAAGGN